MITSTRAASVYLMWCFKEVPNGRPKWRLQMRHFRFFSFTMQITHWTRCFRHLFALTQIWTQPYYSKNSSLIILINIGYFRDNEMFTLCLIMGTVFIKLVIRVTDIAVETGDASQNDGKTIRLSWQITGFNSQVQTDISLIQSSLKHRHLFIQTSLYLLRSPFIFRPIYWPVICCRQSPINCFSHTLHALQTCPHTLKSACVGGGTSL